MAVKTIGKIFSIAELKKFKINKANIKKLTVTDCNNLKKASEAHIQATGVGCQVCCCTPIG